MDCINGCMVRSNLVISLVPQSIRTSFFCKKKLSMYLVIGTLLVKVVDTYVEYAKLSAWKIGVTGVGATGVAQDDAESKDGVVVGVGNVTKVVVCVGNVVGLGVMVTLLKAWVISPSEWVEVDRILSS